MIRYFCDVCSEEPKEGEQLKHVFTRGHLEKEVCDKCEKKIKEFEDNEFEDYQKKFKVIKDEYEAKLKEFIGGMK